MFIPFHSVYSHPCVASTLPRKMPLSCPNCSCRMKFTSDSRRLNHTKLHHLEHLQVPPQKNLTIPSAHQPIELAQHDEFPTDNDSVDELDRFPFLEHVKNGSNSVAQPLPPPLPLTEFCCRASALVSDYFAVLWESNSQGSLETNLQAIPTTPF